MSSSAIRDSLLKVAANMPSLQRSGDITLEQLIQASIIERPHNRYDIYPECELAAAEANYESRQMPTPIEIRFIKGLSSRQWNGGAHNEKFMFTRIN